MDAIRFTWDARKDKANQKKHGISFSEAKTVLNDANARLIYDPDHSLEEERFIMMGLSISFRLLVVVHCYNEDNNLIRIISARKASKKERKQYEEFLK
ncbi:MAG: BrnT family toxin [Candidatus Aminicenantes bacterium]|nr:BrnT family toxin [Candidatus Aminicenantes bacterium]NIM78346.1 BrnT family toxin [Candidatus Aminicenantes bacterium]NIN17580.1 BrnT family toxin [Candidatus Aminicenantes bacterium]NIN41458.1 BrnT family toxin [Candidatus Aminicenantes bacterium]NIN84232.1 BrnT family toxin [Candidatus Aminicenantes bacterium]